MSTRIVATALLAGLAAVALVVVVRFLSAEEPETSSEPIVVSLGDRRLALPRNLVRFAAERTARPQNRIDLAFLWPELRGRGEADAARFDTPGLAPDVVVATLTPAGDGLDSAARLATVWSRFFEGEPRPGPDGLVVRTMAAASGYAGEEIVFEPGAVRPFAARCFPLTPGEAANVCLHVTIDDGLMAEWRFPAERLAEWRRLADALPALVARWRAAAASGGR
jgi:hypothetical protein